MRFNYLFFNIPLLFLTYPLLAEKQKALLKSYNIFSPQNRREPVNSTETVSKKITEPIGSTANDRG